MGEDDLSKRIRTLARKLSEIKTFYGYPTLEPFTGPSQLLFQIFGTLKPKDLIMI